MTYIVVSENEIVKAEMERPECFRADDTDEDCPDCWPYIKHLLSLPSIPAPGHKWKLWDEVVEGKDFTWKYEFLSGRPPMHSTVWLECSKEEWGKIKPRYKRTIAIPIQNKIVKEDMICPETGKYCDDECCTVGSICNVSGSTDGISPQPTPEGEEVEEDKKSANEILEQESLMLSIKTGNHWYKHTELTDEPVLEMVIQAMEKYSNQFR